jgi:hypothetical protein
MQSSVRRFEVLPALVGWGVWDTQKDEWASEVGWTRHEAQTLNVYYNRLHEEGRYDEYRGFVARSDGR